jgi:ribosomal protein S18 acetylase RimI-like enzyme
MELTFRAAQLEDIPGMFVLRERTRENAITREELALLGITPASTSARMKSGQSKSWVCSDGAALVGFCSGDTLTGEVLVVAVLPQFERRDVGKRLLLAVVAALHAAGCRRVWLAASANPHVRSYGFYRALGWRATGERAANGDELLEYALSDR